MCPKAIQLVPICQERHQKLKDPVNPVEMKYLEFKYLKPQMHIPGKKFFLLAIVEPKDQGAMIINTLAYAGPGTSDCWKS